MTTEAQRRAPLVLVADNDTGVNALLQEVLVQSGLRTASVTDGEAALKLIQSTSIALLVCDLDMPKVGGEEVLRQLEHIPNAPPVVVISGFLDNRLEEELRGHSHVREVFRKPFDVFQFAEFAAQITARNGFAASESG